MAIISGGLEIIELRNGTYIDPPNGFPYNKPFVVFNRIWYSVLVMEVLTSYSVYAPPLATVRINGNTIGEIPPLAWGTQVFGTFPQLTFNPGNLNDSAFGVPPYNLNYLSIVPPANEYIILGRAWLHYNQYIP